MIIKLKNENLHTYNTNFAEFENIVFDTTGSKFIKSTEQQKSSKNNNLPPTAVTLIFES